MMHVATNTHEHEQHPPEVPCKGMWRATVPATFDNPNGLALWWLFEDGREVSDTDLRCWCYLNLEGIWRYMDVARRYHLNSWAAAHPSCGKPDDNDILRRALHHLRMILIYTTDGHHSDFWGEFRKARDFLKSLGEV